MCGYGKSQQERGSGIDDELNEVVVMGYVTERKRRYYSTTTVDAYSITAARSGEGENASSRGKLYGAEAEVKHELPGQAEGRQTRRTLYFISSVAKRQYSYSFVLLFIRPASFWLRGKGYWSEILSNIASWEAENYELGKLLAYS